MGYNGSNRSGLPQKGSGSNKSSFKFGSAIFGGIAGLIGAFCGPLGILFLFIAIFNFEAFIFILELLAAVFVIGVILAANGILEPNKRKEQKDNSIFPNVK